MCVPEEFLHANGFNRESVDLHQPRPEGSIKGELYDMALEIQQLKAELADNRAVVQPILDLINERFDDTEKRLAQLEQQVYEDNA